MTMTVMMKIVRNNLSDLRIMFVIFLVFAPSCLDPVNLTLVVMYKSPSDALLLPPLSFL